MRLVNTICPFMSTYSGDSFRAVNCDTECMLSVSCDDNVSCSFVINHIVGVSVDSRPIEYTTVEVKNGH